MYYLSTDAIIWDVSSGDTFCRMCRDCDWCKMFALNDYLNIDAQKYLPGDINGQCTNFALCNVAL